jgi:competence protein ComEC
LYQAHHALHPGLDPVLEGKDLVISGMIASIPETRESDTRFLFDIERVRTEDAAGRSNFKRVRLSWYGSAPELRFGQRWRRRVIARRYRGGWRAANA